MERDIMIEFVCHESASLVIDDASLIRSTIVNEFLVNKKSKVIVYDNDGYRDTLKDFFNGEAEVTRLSDIQMKRKCFCFMPVSQTVLYDLMINKCTFLHTEANLDVARLVERLETKCRGISTLYSTYASYQLFCSANVYVMRKKTNTENEVEVYRPEWNTKERSFEMHLMYTGGL